MKDTKWNLLPFNKAMIQERHTAENMAFNWEKSKEICCHIGKGEEKKRSQLC